MNQKMNVLKALGIITVVAGHSGTDFFRFFPVYSFHMPLFIFISGYFFYDTNVLSYVKKKAKSLLLPHLVWNFAYGVLVTLLLSYGLIKFGTTLSLKTVLWDPFIGGWQFHFNGPAWFIGTLFFVQILYLILKQLLGNKQIIIGG